MAGPYDADSVRVMRLDMVRLRPGMYIGNPEDGQHRMLWEVVGNAVDEHLRGDTRGYVRITLRGFSASVDDDGRGLPIDDVVPLMTTLTGPKVKIPHLHLGPELFGAGVGVVSALSDRVEVEVRRDGQVHRQRFARGAVAGPLEALGSTTQTGTRVTFEPDPTVVQLRPWDVAAINERARELAALVPRLTMIVDGEATCYPDGLGDHVCHVTRGRRLVDPIHARGTIDGIQVDAAIAWVDAAAPAVEGFVNGSRCIEGTHLDGLRLGIQRGVGRLLRGGARGRAASIERGLVAIVHAMLADPRYGNPTMDWLTNADVKVAVQRVVEDAFAAAATSHPSLDALLARLA